MKIIFNPKLSLEEEDKTFIEQLDTALIKCCQAREDCTDCPFRFNDDCCRVAFFEALEDISPDVEPD